MEKTNYFKWMLFFSQVVAHLSVIPMIMYGTWYHWVIAFFVYFMTGCFGMTMTFHRLLSHKSWNPPKWYYKFGTLCGIYGLTGSSIGWVAVHREHHHHTDKEGDPHSPRHHGFFKVQWLSMFETPKPKYAIHLIRDKFHMFIHKWYFQLHLAIAGFWLLIDPMLLVAAYLFPAMILWNAGSFINTLTHMFGYRNYNTTDDSTNIPVLGILMWGEGWHNNHHADPNNPSFKRKWWELDVGGLFIKLLSQDNKESMFRNKNNATGTGEIVK
jgi:stearoyl-CoA desaturase (delta-9 desaturase)